jgi:hypothetical protein
MLRLVDPVRLVVDALVAVTIVHAQEPFKVVLSCDGDVITLSVQNSDAQTVARSVEALDSCSHRLAAFPRLGMGCGVTMQPDSSRSAWASFAALNGDFISPREGGTRG